MARAYVKIYVNGEHVRTFGGNKAAVRELNKWYKGMTKEQFLIKHPRFSDCCSGQYVLTTYVRVK